MYYFPLRKAFSMIEVVFVIVILGIVSSIGAEIIANVYENYIVQRAQHRASIKTQLALNQITNRLRHAIPNTMGRRVDKTSPFLLATNLAPGNYSVLQWVGADVESFEAITSTSNRSPGWSGFIDIDASNPGSLSSPASNFSLANTIKTNLGRTGNYAIYFPGDPTPYPATVLGSTITTAAGRIVERYKLSSSSHALVVENGDLMFYTNFSPIVGSNILGTGRLLLKNVSNFKFQTRGQTTRIKICVEEKITNGLTIPSCKEKAIF